MKKTVIVWLLVSLIPAGFAALPLFGKEFIPTHDGEYHIIRFWQFAKMITAGHWFPRWAPDLNSGYGIPLFNFHYPFPNYIGTALHAMGLSFVDSFKVAMGLGYILTSGLTYLWLQKIFGKWTACAATIVFSFVPYWFVELYVRGSIGEVYALLWSSLGLVAIVYRRPRLFAISVALMILSHNITSLILFPQLLLFVWMNNKRLIFWGFVGIVLSAYFWVPAIFERQWVTGLNSVNYLDHFPEVYQLFLPSWGTGFSLPGITSSEMSFQLGLVPILVVLFSIYYLRKEADRRLQWTGLGIIGIWILAVFLMLPASVNLWGLTGFLAYVQYPWRFLVALIPIVGFLTAYVVRRVRAPWVGIVVVALSILASFPYIRPVVYAPRSDEHYLSRQEFTGGTNSLGNTFGTIWSPAKKMMPLSRATVESGDAQVLSLSEGIVSNQFKVKATTPTVMEIHRLYYPGWSVLVDSMPVSIDYKRSGTIRVDIPPGEHIVQAFFTETFFRRVVDAISAICLFWLLASFILKKYAYRD